VLRFGKETAYIREHFLNHASNSSFKSVMLGARINREKYATAKCFALAITPYKIFESFTKIVAL
jgi:hypothetical protein